jgi:tetratricopeptide (TPR) repeat protein
MSPEQAVGAAERIGPRSDVFGLGGTLCALLTGKPPYLGANDRTLVDMAALADLGDCFARLDDCGAEPELINLCKRCLARESRDRPADGSEVAREVAEFRATAAERARRAEIEREKAEVRADAERDKAAVRSKEQRRRRRVWLAVACVSLVGGVVSTWQAIRATAAERTVIERETETARERDAGDQIRAAEAFQRARAEKAQTHAVDATRAVVGWANLLSTSSALPELRDAGVEVADTYRRIISAVERLPAEQRASPEVMLATGIGHLSLGEVERRRGGVAEATINCRRGIAILEQLPGDRAELPAVRFALANGHLNLAEVEGQRDDPAEATGHHQQAIRLLERLAADFPNNPTYPLSLGQAYSRFGSFKARASLSDAITLCDQGVDLLTSHEQRHPNDPDVKNRLKDVRLRRAVVLDARGDYNKSADEWGKVIELSAEQDQPSYRVNRAYSRAQAGSVLDALDEADKLSSGISKVLSLGPGERQKLACVYSLASGRIVGKKEEYGRRAVQLLEEAGSTADGFHLSVRDPAFDPVRDRGDFKKWLADLEKRFPTKREVLPTPRREKRTTRE